MNSFGVTKLGDSVRIQRQVFTTLIDEGFFTDSQTRSRTDINKESGLVETIKIAIKKSPQKNKFWVHSIYTIENVSDSPASTNNGTEAGHITADWKIIPQKNTFVNTPGEKIDEIKNNANQEMYQGVPEGSLANTTRFASDNSIADAAKKNNTFSKKTSKSFDSGRRSALKKRSGGAKPGSAMIGIDGIKKRKNEL